MSSTVLPADISRYSRDALARLVAIPSVAAEGRSLTPAAEVVQELLEALGATTELHATDGAPVVFATSPAPPGKPTVLFYNHYDVQPADPLELWHRDPFALTEEEGVWYGRGVSDDKGHLVSRLAALRWLKAEHGELPLGFKFLVEGEEEVGSPNLMAYVLANLGHLSADGCVWESGGVTATGRPTAYFGMKGVISLELKVTGPSHDLHSSYGAVVENPIYHLASALASLRDEQGRVRVAGFYDDVVPLTASELELLGALPDEGEELKGAFGVDGYIGGVSGAEFQRQLLTEPNINYNGFHSGYGGPGSKTVLPAEATAKLDIRLVPDQDPDRIVKVVREHLDASGFQDVTLTELETSSKAARSETDHAFVRAAIQALREGFGSEPVAYPNVAGSGPMHPFVAELGLPVVGIGCGHPGSREHSPNENVRVADYERSVVALKRFLEIVALGE